MKIDKMEGQSGENIVCSLTETSPQPVKKAIAKRPGMSEKRRLKRHVCIDLSAKFSSSDSEADDHTTDGNGTIGLEHFKNDSSRWEPGSPSQRNLSPTRKLTR